MEELIFSPAVRLAEEIRSRRVSALEVLEAYLERIQRYNPALNAIVTLDGDRARQRAREADAALARGETWGPLHGVPVTIKDCFETAGLRTTASYKPLAHYVPDRDATVVARIRAAGAILLGKTNLPELAMDIQTNSPVFGRANNPWDPERTPGGSTGGGAAAVAAGLSPLEIGSDLGGSIRIPSHFCGLFGLKPTEHRVPDTGHIPPVPGDPKTVRHMGVFGPLARSVEDLKLCLRLIAGPDGRDWEVPPASLDEAPGRPLKETRLAWTDAFGPVPVSADTRATLEGLARDLEGLGCRVERADPLGFDFEEAWTTYGEIVGTEAGFGIPATLQLLGTISAATLCRGDLVFAGMMRGARLSMGRYVRALGRRDTLIGALERFLEDWDAWICPVAPVPAFKHLRPAARMPGQPIEIDGRRLPYWLAAVSYTSVFNLTGSPVVVLPVGRSGQGLPIGVQVVGRRWHEPELLALASRLSDVTGTFQPPPGY